VEADRRLHRTEVPAEGTRIVRDGYGEEPTVGRLPGRGGGPVTILAVPVLAVVFVTVCGGQLLRLGGAAHILGRLAIGGPGSSPWLTIAVGMVMWLAGQVLHRLRRGRWESRTAGLLVRSGLSVPGCLTRLVRSVLASDVRGRAGSG
jgi:hypothetical protein